MAEYPEPNGVMTIRSAAPVKNMADYGARMTIQRRTAASRGDKILRDWLDDDFHLCFEVEHIWTSF